MARGEVVNTFWHGRDLSTVEVSCLMSFIARGVGVRLFTYRDMSVPKEIDLADAGSIIEPERLFLFDGSPSAFTNLFRYKLLHTYGGWWVDCDVALLSPQMPEDHQFWGKQDRRLLNGAVLRFPKDDPICATLLEFSASRMQQITRWGELGPELLTEVIWSSGKYDISHEPRVAYPIHWLEIHYLWCPEFREIVSERIAESSFLHLWHSMFSRMGIDIVRPPPPGGFLDEFSAQNACSARSTNADPQIDVSERTSIMTYLSQDWVQSYWKECAPAGYGPLHLPTSISQQSASTPAPSVGNEVYADGGKRGTDLELSNAPWEKSNQH